MQRKSLDQKKNKNAKTQVKGRTLIFLYRQNAKTQGRTLIIPYQRTNEGDLGNPINIKQPTLQHLMGHQGVSKSGTKVR